MPPGEWQAFIDTLRRPLPLTFRVNGSGRYARELRDKLEADFFSNFAAGPIYVGALVFLYITRLLASCPRPRAQRTGRAMWRGPEPGASRGAAAPLQPASGAHTPQPRPRPAHPLPLPLPRPQLDGEQVDPPRALEWYPGRLAWQLEFSRGQLRKVGSGAAGGRAGDRAEGSWGEGQGEGAAMVRLRRSPL